MSDNGGQEKIYHVTVFTTLHVLILQTMSFFIAAVYQHFTRRAECEKLRKTGGHFHCSRFSLGSRITMRNTVMFFVGACTTSCPKHFTPTGPVCYALRSSPLIRRKNLSQIPKLVSGRGRRRHLMLSMLCGDWRFRDPSALSGVRGVCSYRIC